MAKLKTDVFNAASQIIETPNASVTGENIQVLFSGRTSKALTDFGLLIRAPHLQEVEVEIEGELRTYPVERHDGGWRYFLEGSGWLTVSGNQLNSLAINFDVYLRSLMNALGVPERVTPEQVCDGKIWYLGQAWLNSTKTNIVFARRLNDDDTASALNSFLDDRHKRDPAMVITSSISVPSYLRLPHQNRLLNLSAAVDLQEDHLCFKVDYMAEKMGGSVMEPGFNNGYRNAYLNGQQYSFTPLQAEVLELLHQSAKAMHKTEIMSQVTSEQEEVKSVFRVNGKYHPAWNKVIKNDKKGNYWVEI